MSELRRLAQEYRELAEQVLERAKSDPSVPYHVVRKAMHIISTPIEDLERALAELAKQFGGCVSCAHSTPHEDVLELTARGCRLGLSQSTCHSYRPLI